MVEYKTIRVPESDYEQAKTLKEEYDRTWGEQLIAGDAQNTEEFDRITQMMLRAEEQLHPDADTDNEFGNKALMESLEAHDDAVANGIDTIINKIDGLSVSLDAAERKQLARDIAEELR